MLQCKLTSEELEALDERNRIAMLAAGAAWPHDPQTRDRLSPYLSLIGSTELDVNRSCYPPKLWTDEQGVVRAGMVGSEGLIDRSDHFPVREVFHLRTHPLVIVVTDLDIFVMPVEEYASQV